MLLLVDYSNQLVDYIKIIKARFDLAAPFLHDWTADLQKIGAGVSRLSCPPGIPERPPISSPRQYAAELSSPFRVWRSIHIQQLARQGPKDDKRLLEAHVAGLQAEADNCVHALRAGNVITAKRRLCKAVEFIAKNTPQPLRVFVIHPPVSRDGKRKGFLTYRSAVVAINANALRSLTLLDDYHYLDHCSSNLPKALFNTLESPC